MDYRLLLRGAGAGHARHAPIMLIVAVAMILMVPAWLAEPLVRDSFWIDFVWADQFSAQLRDGILYPRWLPQSHDGLGAPVFYFYPPLAFYLTGLFSLLGLSTYASVIAAFGAALAASGMAMFVWLKGWTRHPLLGALLYIAMPYHIVDFYNRGALAEFCAYALIPLVAIGLRRAARSRRFSLLALAYAALIMTHLPAALLTSIFFIMPYSLYLGSRDRQALAPLLMGGIFGIGIATLYLLPMLVLQPHVALETMVMRADLEAANWSLLTPDRWPSVEGVHLMLLLAGSLIWGAVILLCARRDIWALAALIYIVILLGLIPGLWSLPLLAKVQFPWRMLMLAEFVIVTAIARTRLRPVLLALAVMPMLMLSVALMPRQPAATADVLDDYRAHHPDVIEYLPKGAPFNEEGYSKWALELARDHRRDFRVGGDIIAADFYFPAWQVSCDGRLVSTRADPTTKLLRWTGETCEARIGWTWSERVGTAISLLCLGLLALLSARAHKGKVRTGLRLAVQLDIAPTNAPTAPSS